MEGSGIPKPMATRRTSRFSDPVSDKGPPPDELKKAAEAIKQEYKSLIQHLTHLHGIGTSYTDDRTLSMFAPNMQLPPELRGLKEQEKERRERLKELRDELRKRKETEPVGLADWFESDSGSFLEGRAAKVAKQDPLEGSGGEGEEEGDREQGGREGGEAQGGVVMEVDGNRKLDMQGVCEAGNAVQCVNAGVGGVGNVNSENVRESMAEDPVVADRKVVEKETGGRSRSCLERRSRRGDNRQVSKKDERRQRERNKGKDRGKDRGKASDKGSGPRRRERDHRSHQEEHKSSRSLKRKQSKSKDTESVRAGGKRTHGDKSDQQKASHISSKGNDDSKRHQSPVKSVLEEVKKTPDDVPVVNAEENQATHSKEVGSHVDGGIAKNKDGHQAKEMNKDIQEVLDASRNCSTASESAGSKVRELNKLDAIVADGLLLKWYQDTLGASETKGPDSPAQDEKPAASQTSPKDDDGNIIDVEPLDNVAEKAMKSARAQLIAWLQLNDSSFVCLPCPFQSSNNVEIKKVEEPKAKVVIKRNSFFPVPRQKPKEENPDFAIVKPTAVPKIIFNENGSAESVRPEDGESASSAALPAALQPLVSGVPTRAESSAAVTTGPINSVLPAPHVFRQTPVSHQPPSIMGNHMLPTPLVRHVPPGPVVPAHPPLEHRQPPSIATPIRPVAGFVPQQPGPPLFHRSNSDNGMQQFGQYSHSLQPPGHNLGPPLSPMLSVSSGPLPPRPHVQGLLPPVPPPRPPPSGPLQLSYSVRPPPRPPPRLPTRPLSLPGNGDNQANGGRPSQTSPHLPPPPPPPLSEAGFRVPPPPVLDLTTQGPDYEVGKDEEEMALESPVAQVPPPPPPLTSHPMFAGQGPSAHPPSRPPLQGVTFTVGGLSAPKSEYSQAFPSTHSGESAAVPTSGSLQRPRFIAQHPAGNPFQSPPFM